jgi:hypothetical protein
MYCITFGRRRRGWKGKNIIKCKCNCVVFTPNFALPLLIL